MTDSKSDMAARSAETVKQKAAEATESVKTEATKRAEGAKSSLAEEVSSIASALKTASREFSDGSAESRTFNQVAEGLAGMSDAIKQKSLNEMVSDLNSFARRNPAAFLGGAALLGFAASRFAKASAESAGSQPSAGQPSAGQPSAGMTTEPRFPPATSEHSRPEPKL